MTCARQGRCHGSHMQTEMSSRGCVSASRWRLLGQHVRQQALSLRTGHEGFKLRTCGSSLCLVGQPVRKRPPHLISQCYAVTSGRQQNGHASRRVYGARDDAETMTAHPHGAVQRKHIRNRVLYMLTNVSLQPDMPMRSATVTVASTQSGSWIVSDPTS